MAEEALSIALYVARIATNFEEGLCIAVTHSGDSDSTAAIAGNLLGLVFPDEVLAHPWRRRSSAPISSTVWLVTSAMPAITPQASDSPWPYGRPILGFDCGRQRLARMTTFLGQLYWFVMPALWDPSCTPVRLIST